MSKEKYTLPNGESAENRDNSNYYRGLKEERSYQEEEKPKEVKIFCQECGKKKQKIAWDEISSSFNSKTGKKDIRHREEYFCTNYRPVNSLALFLSLGIMCGLLQKGCPDAVSSRIDRCQYHRNNNVLVACPECGACVGGYDI